MLRLHALVLECLSKVRLQCESIAASELVRLGDGGRLSLSALGALHLERCRAAGLVPVTFGDVVLSDRGAYILSGDRILEALATNLRPSRAIFAMDVDGIYKSLREGGQLIADVGRSDIDLSLGGARRFDVTGGLRAKLEAGFRLARLGSDVFYVNGYKMERVKALIEGRNAICSKIVAE
jgi:isopentenyl phosphate kinase